MPSLATRRRRVESSEKSASSEARLEGGGRIGNDDVDSTKQTEAKLKAFQQQHTEEAKLKRLAHLVRRKKKVEGVDADGFGSMLNPFSHLILSLVFLLVVCLDFFPAVFVWPPCSLFAISSLIHFHLFHPSTHTRHRCLCIQSNTRILSRKGKSNRDIQ